MFPFKDYVTTFRDGISRALRVKAESVSEGRLNEPKLIATLPFSDLASGVTINLYLNNCLSRNAKDRTFTFLNTTNATTTSGKARMYDSITNANRTTGGGNQDITINSTTNNFGTSVETSRLSPMLAASVDSIHLMLTNNTTAATTGEFKIYVTEVF